MLVNPKVTDFNNYVLINNDPLQDGHVVVDVKDEEFRQVNSKEVIALDDGRIFMLNIFMDMINHIKIGDFIELEKTKKDGLYLVHRSTP